MHRPCNASPSQLRSGESAMLTTPANQAANVSAIDLPSVHSCKQCVYSTRTLSLPPSSSSCKNHPTITNLRDIFGLADVRRQIKKQHRFVVAIGANGLPLTGSFVEPHCLHPPRGVLLRQQAVDVVVVTKLPASAQSPLNMTCRRRHHQAINCDNKQS